MKGNGTLHLKDFLYGLITGVTTTIPGVSFGTLAMLFNIYEKFINAFSPENIKKSIGFLVTFFVGCGCSLFLFSRLVTYLISEYQTAMYFAFIGMIIGCVPMIYKRAEYEKVKPRNVLIFAVALVFMALLAFINDSSLGNRTLDEFAGNALFLFLWFFVSGFAASLAMIIPGLSGSIIILMLGTYAATLEAVATLNFLVLAPFGVGVAVGIFAGIKLVKILLNRHYQASYSAILGLILGSIFIIYPGFTFGTQGLVAIILAVVCGVLTYIFSKAGGSKG